MSTFIEAPKHVYAHNTKDMVKLDDRLANETITEPEYEHITGFGS